MVNSVTLVLIPVPGSHSAALQTQTSGALQPGLEILKALSQVLLTDGWGMSRLTSEVFAGI